MKKNNLNFLLPVIGAALLAGAYNCQINGRKTTAIILGALGIIFSGSVLVVGGSAYGKEAKKG